MYVVKKKQLHYYYTNTAPLAGDHGPGHPSSWSSVVVVAAYGGPTSHNRYYVVWQCDLPEPSMTYIKQHRAAATRLGAWGAAIAAQHACCTAIAAVRLLRCSGVGGKTPGATSWSFGCDANFALRKWAPITATQQWVPTAK